MNRRPCVVKLLRYVGQLLVLCSLYVATGKLGLAIAPVNVFATFVWPPSGLSLSALLLGGYRMWPGVALGAFVTNLWVGATLPAALGMAAGNTLEALLAAAALRCVPGFRGSLDRFAEVAALTVVGGATSAIGATFGAASLVLAGDAPSSGFGATWTTWWTGDLLGDLIIPPLLLTWALGPRLDIRGAALDEVALLSVFLAGSAALVFVQRPEIVRHSPILQPYVLFLPLIWAAVRHGSRGAATGGFIVAVGAVWGTYRGRGAFARADVAESLLALHVFLAAAALATLALGSVVSELKQSRLRLRDSTERARIAIEAARLGTWFWDVKRDRVTASPLYRGMIGVGPNEPIGYARLLAAVHPDDREDTERELKRALDEHGYLRIEHRVVLPGGAVRWITGLGRTFYDDLGKPERMVGVTLDVTAQKEADEERRALLAREQAARAEAQAATRAKDEFLAVLSHELRTPLQAVLGWAHMLKTPGRDAETVRRALETIERNAKAQARLIEDLLDISRIIGGKLRVDRRRLALAPVVEAAIDAVRTSADAKSIRLDARVDALEGVVMGDAGRLQQVVVNLLTNAVKFTPEHGRIAVRLEQRGMAARITVEDTGAGISPAFLPYVFDRFRQSESVAVRHQGGLGLGLAIVRHLVEAHGGSVTAESPGEGLGATFTVTLPLVSPEDPESAA